MRTIVMSKFSRMAEKKEPVKDFLIKLFIWVVVIPILGFIVYLYYDSFLYTISPIFNKYKVQIIVIVFTLIFIPKIFRYIKAIVKRHFIIKRLRKISKRKGFSFIKLRNMYRSIFITCSTPQLILATSSKHI